MPEQFIPDEKALNELKCLLRQINYDVSVINRNIYDTTVLVSYLSLIEDNANKALQLIGGADI